VTAVPRRPLDPLRWCLVTACGLGLSPFAPGTVGTLGGVLIGVTLQWWRPEQALLAWVVVAAALFVAGCLQTRYVARAFGTEDPGPFVLDEVVGHLVTLAVYAALAGRLPHAVGHMAAFFAFRAFDVVKPQPARWLEGLPGALGIMADDVMAGVYAGLSLWLVLPVFG
jgi:phosphatidylglycerophosphatase A